MTLNKYKKIKLLIVVVISIIFSQSIIYKNFLIPIATVIISWLILIKLKHQVKEITADERDYAIGGKSALTAIQVYSMTAVVVMFILYSLREQNHDFEIIAQTLAYSTCILMFLYSIIFRLKNKN